MRAAPQYWRIALDGTGRDNATVNTPAPFLAGIWTVGRAAHALSLFYSGQVAYVMFYGAARTDGQQAQNRQALTTILAARGITLP